MMAQFRRWFATKLDIDRELYPSKMLYKKHKTPPNMYVAQESAAKLIDSSIQPLLERYVPASCDTAVEMNPGVGLLSRKLIANQRFRKVVLVESQEHFLPNLFNLKKASKPPERVTVKYGDLTGIWKLAYQDKIDNGTRVNDLLEDVPKRGHDDEPNCVLFGTVGSYKFFQHLINSLTFQTSLLSWGRCEMFLVMPPPIYIHLTCSNEIGYMLYRSTSMLFQMLFEYRYIATVPRELFLPAQIAYKASKNSKLTRVTSINPEYLYVVRITPRRDFLKLCPVEDLPALWYFVKQNCVSRRNRVIPNLEKWVPGCGPRLIVHDEQLEQPVKPLYSDEDAQALPKYSIQCTTMSTGDFYPHMNIFTQFGDLNASQMLTLFTQFRHWPEYGQSSFLASYENSLLKLEAASDEGLDDIVPEEDDDVTSEPDATAPADEKLESTTTKGRKRKTKTIS